MDIGQTRHESNRPMNLGTSPGWNRKTDLWTVHVKLKKNSQDVLLQIHRNLSEEQTLKNLLDERSVRNILKGKINHTENSLEIINSKSDCRRGWCRYRAGVSDKISHETGKIFIGRGRGAVNAWHSYCISHSSSSGNWWQKRLGKDIAHIFVRTCTGSQRRCNGI